MVFTIVSTLRSQGKNIIKEFSAVPSSWIDGNQVLWPQNHNLANFIKDPKSVPQPSWKSHLCCIHRQNIKSFQEAVMWEAKFAEVDSDNDEESNHSIDIKIEPPPEPSIESYKSYADLFKIEEDSNDQNDDEVELISIKEETLSEPDINAEKTHCQCQKVTHDAITEIKTELVAIRRLLEQQQTYIQNNKVVSLSSSEKNDHEFSSKFSFPIDTTEDLKALDHIIGENDEYRKYLIERFGRICGSGGNGKGANKMALKLVSDLIFTRALLTKCSWTGKSRTIDVKKLPFCIFNNVVCLVDEILNNVDNRWNIMDTESLFREKLLKHAKVRNCALMERKKKSINISTTTMKLTTTNFNNSTNDTNDNNTRNNTSSSTSIKRTRYNF